MRTSSSSTWSLQGEVKEDDYITEQRLAEAFGMSRAPVREALNTLCAEHIMESAPRLGYRVAPISLKEILDCIDVRLILEAESVRLACLNRTPESLERLDAFIAEYERRNSGANLHQWVHHADTIHFFLADMSNNVILTRSITPLIDLIRRGCIQLINMGRLEPKEEHFHMAILRAVQDGDSKKAQDLIREDILVVKNILLSR